MDLNERLVIDQDTLSVSITKELLKVVTQILVTSNDLCVLREKDNDMAEVNFQGLTNDMIKVYFNKIILKRH